MFRGKSIQRPSGIVGLSRVGGGGQAYTIYDI